MNIIWLQLTCLIFMSILLGVYFSSKRLTSIETSIFKKIMIANEIGLLIELFCFYTISHIESLPILNYFTTHLLLVYYLTYTLLFTSYLMLVVRKESPTKKYIRTVIIFCIVYFLINTLFIFMLPMNYNIETNKIYSYGPSVNFLFASYSVLTILWCIIIAMNIKKLKKGKILPIIILIVLGTIVGIIQKLHPELLLLTGVETVVTFIMYFTIENPDMKLLKELQKSKEISDKANDEKNLFIYNMTQESRRITNEINQNIDYILQIDSISEIKDVARDILNSTAKYSNSTYDILGAQNEENNSLKVYNEKYNLKNIIREIIRINKNKCQEKNIEFRTNIDTNIPEILYGDSIILKENINDLIELSINQTEKGYIEFNINTLIKEDSCRLFISISDSSKGYTSEELNILLNNNKKLSKINSNIIKLNGILSITSDLRLGTNIKIILDQRIEKLESIAKKYEGILKVKEVLLIANSSSCKKIVEKILNGFNIRLDIAKDISECLNNIKLNKYDAILIDEELEDISGIEARKKMNNIKNFKAKTILLTKNNNYEYNDQYKEQGFNDFVLKPLNKNKLLDKIQ